MHRHFRVIAISEYLRCRGFDPDVYKHTRIPGIWKELAIHYNLEAIDDRDNNIDYAEDPDYDSRFKEFALPPDFHDEMIARAVVDSATAATSPAQWEPEPPTIVPSATKSNAGKRKRGDAAARARSSTIESSDTALSHPSPAGARAARSTRSQKRAASKAQPPSAEPEPEEEEDAGGGDDGGDGEAEPEEEEEVQEAPAVKRVGGSRARGRGRARGGAGRNRGRKSGG